MYINTNLKYNNGPNKQTLIATLSFYKIFKKQSSKKKIQNDYATND